MVSTRRTQKSSENELDASVTASSLPSPTRRSKRRTRSNSRSEAEELVTEEKNSDGKQLPQSKKASRRRRGSSVDDKAKEETPHELVVDDEPETAATDSLVQSQGGTEQEEETSMVNAATKSAAESAVARRPSPTETREEASDDNGLNGNELTSLIPGYVAPLSLDTSPLDSYRPSGGLADLTRRAQQTDASTAGFVVDAAEPHAQVMKKKSNGCMPTTYASLYSSFKHGTKRAPDHSAGAGWFGMQPTQMTDELKTDLAVIRNRNYLDPKRFYKSADTNRNKVMQVGTVIEGSAEFYSSRLTKKQRRTNLTEEIMADPEAADYTKRKYKRMQQEKSAKGQKQNRKKMSKRARRGY